MRKFTKDEIRQARHAKEGLVNRIEFIARLMEAVNELCELVSNELERQCHECDWTAYDVKLNEHEDRLAEMEKRTNKPAYHDVEKFYRDEPRGVYSTASGVNNCAWNENERCTNPKLNGGNCTYTQFGTPLCSGYMVASKEHDPTCMTEHDLCSCTKPEAPKREMWLRVRPMPMMSCGPTYDLVSGHTVNNFIRDVNPADLRESLPDCSTGEHASCCKQICEAEARAEKAEETLADCKFEISNLKSQLAERDEMIREASAIIHSLYMQSAIRPSSTLMQWRDKAQAMLDTRKGEE